MKNYLLISMMLFVALISTAQNILIQPTMMPAGGVYDDNVKVVCTFPEGCSGGKYWINGGELVAKPCGSSILVENTCDLSVAGVNAEGRIITEVITKHFDIKKVTPAWTSVEPREGIRKESFYVTKIGWHNVSRSLLDLSEFQPGQPREGEPVVWLTNESGKKVASNDYNGIWQSGQNGFKVYLYKNYNQTVAGKYTLHVAAGIFVLDDKVYDKELTYVYEVGGSLTKPVITPDGGEYADSVLVTIEYPEKDKAYYQLYKLSTKKKTFTYDEPFWLTENTTVEAWGMNEAMTETTEHVSVTYSIVSASEKEGLKAPMLSRKDNIVTISGPEGATLKYWMNDSMQTACLYKEPITVTRNGKISAVAYTDKAVSQTVDLAITGFVVDRGDYGDEVRFTPSNLQELFVNMMSPNGRFAVGTVGTGTSSRGFVWDLQADVFSYTEGVYANQLLYISNNGDAYGWSLTSLETSEDTTEDDLLWGVYRDGQWIPRPEGLIVNGMSAEGLLFGSKDGRPVAYDVDKSDYIVYDGRGVITAMAETADVVAGVVEKGGKNVIAVWTSPENVKTYDELVANSVTDLSPNGQWAIVGQDYRLNIETEQVEKLISMTYLTSNTHNPEILRCIANDGTIFGTYDSSLISPDNGVALVYTVDGRWRSAGDWLREVKGYENTDYALTSVRSVSADHNMMLFSAFPVNMALGEIFTRGMVVRMNVQVHHLAPGYLQAAQMQGAEIVKLTWMAPLYEAKHVTAYTLYRDGKELAKLSANDLLYFDENVQGGMTYHYTITASYDDEVVSVPSFESVVTVNMTRHLPARDLNVRRVGINNVCVTWTTPVVSIPKLQYFNEEKEGMAFGTRGYNSEWGIRIAKEDLKVYAHEKIRTFQFLPTGKQDGYVLNLYRGTKGNSYEDEPFYSQVINPETLTYGSVNMIILDEPQDVPTDVDLYVALYIHGKGANMLGVQYEGFRSGYTDLCRVEGVHEKMIIMSEESTAGPTEIVLPLGIGICSEELMGGSIVTNYELMDGDKVLQSTENPRVNLSNVAMGEHYYSVRTTYYDKVVTPGPDTVHLTMTPNMDAYHGILPQVNVEKSDATMTWTAPRDNDQNRITWADMTPTPGFPAQPFYDMFTAAAIYPMDLTELYNEDYQITGVYFYADAPATFQVSLEDGFDKLLAYWEPKDVQLHAFNYLSLPTPIKLNSSLNYTLSIDVLDAEEMSTPLAYDASNRWRDEFSNILYLDGEYMTLRDVSSIGEHPNWLMGMNISLCESQIIPVDGYDIYLDGKKVADMVMSNDYDFKNLTDGEHTARVDVHYNGVGMVAGTPVPFYVGKREALEEVEIDPWGFNSGCYDLLGRPVEPIAPGVYIINSQKVIR